MAVEQQSKISADVQGHIEGAVRQASVIVGSVQEIQKASESLAVLANGLASEVARFQEQADPLIATRRSLRVAR